MFYRVFRTFLWFTVGAWIGVHVIGPLAYYDPSCITSTARQRAARSLPLCTPGQTVGCRQTLDQIFGK